VHPSCQTLDLTNSSMTVVALQHQFLIAELGMLSLNASLATRNADWPIYARSCELPQRSAPKAALRSTLRTVEAAYVNGSKPPKDHTRFIEVIATRLSDECSEHFFNGCFRFGVAQKLVNLHLKYLWVARLCPEPPHCPIDGIIRDHAGIEFNWTSSNSVEEYEVAVGELRALAGGKSLAHWELEAFERRRQ
jgi:hypothetical protein